MRSVGQVEREIKQDNLRVIKFIRRREKYTWQDYTTNEDMLSELKINPIVGSWPG
jgi:hypothetical protein